MIKRLFIILFVFIPFSLFAADNPYTNMENAASSVFGRLKAEQSKIRVNPELLRTIVKQELLPYVQVKYAGSLILGRYYKEITPAQRELYFQAFEDYLVQVYSQAFTLYDGQKYQMDSPKSVDNKDIVTIRISLLDPNNKQPVRLDFQWRKNTKTGEWKAYDLITEGVSMITSKQSEWSAILRQQGIDALTAQLKQLAKTPISFS